MGCELLGQHMHAAAVLGRGEKLVDAAWQSALAELTAVLQSAIGGYGGSAPVVWRHLLALSASIDNNRQLVEIVLRKSFGSAPSGEVTRLAGLIADLEAAVIRIQPKLANELLLRAGPLSEQWEARGPGLLRKIGEQIDEDQLFVANADVILVHPIQGGGGEAHLLYNSVRMEAVLANPAADVPEVVRLAWLLVQLNQDLPRYSERLTQRDVHELAALALIPVTLVAAAACRARPFRRGDH